MKKKNLVFCMLTVLVISFSLGLGAYASNDSDVESIKNLLQSYFNDQYLILSNLTLNENLDKYFSPTNERAQSYLATQKGILDILCEHRKLQLNDLRFQRYEFTLDYQEISISGDSAYVKLTENHDIYFNCTPNIKSQMRGLVHEIYLERDGNRWFITQDINKDEFKKSVEDYIKMTGSIDKAREFYLKDSQNEANKIKEQLKQNQEMSLDYGILATFYSYNRTAARTYARNWAYSRNPSWFDYENLGGDCTNFTSQCLYAGGIPFDSSGSYSTQWYWYSDSSRVASWTGASYWRTYALNNNSSSTSNYGLYAASSNWSSMDIGDIVQLYSTSPYHSLIITDEVTNDYLICCHTIDRRDYPLSYYGASKYYYKIYGYYK